MAEELEEEKMDETGAFLSEVLSRFRQAEADLHNGDAGPRLAMWSRTEPVSLLGAAISGSGWDELGPIFEGLGRSFSDCKSYQFEVITAEARGDLGYLIGIEHTDASIDGAPRSYALRSTTIFRREAGEWKAIHRHGSPLDLENAKLSEVGRSSS